MKLPIFLQLTNIQIIPMLLLEIVVLFFGFRYRKITIFLECFLLSLTISQMLLCLLLDHSLLLWIASGIISIIIAFICSVYPLVGLGIWAGIYGYGIGQYYLGTIIGIIIGIVLFTIVFFLVGKFKKKAAIPTMCLLSGFRIIYLVVSLLSLLENQYIGYVYLIGTIALGCIGMIIQFRFKNSID